MSTWITVEPEEFIRSHRQPPVANEQFFRSPFDVPDAVRVTENAGEVIVHFRYLGADERTERVDLNAMVSVEAGRQSRRIFAIHVRQAATLSELARHLGEATAQIRRMTHHLAPENSDAAAEVIDSSSSQLLRDLRLSSIACG